MSDQHLKGQSLRCAPYVLFIFVCVKRAFVLEDHNDLLLARLQLWFDADEFQVLALPAHHPPLERFHFGEELFLSIFPHVIPLMSIHINAFLQPCPPPSQLVQPPLSCALRQPDLKHNTERWKDPLIKSALEVLWGDIPYVQAH